MSFNLIRTNGSQLIDVRNNYKQIADDFLPKYYTVYDNNFNELSTLYYPDSQFTYQDNELIGFNALSQKLYESGVYKFTHHNMTISTQPIGPSNMIITIIGLISLNDSIFTNKFVETLYIQRNDQNKFGICSTIFKMLE